MSWHDDKYPGKPYPAYAAQSNQGRQDDIANSAKGAGQNLDKNKNQIAWNDMQQHIYADINNGRICSEKMKQGPGKYHQQRQDRAADSK